MYFQPRRTYLLLWVGILLLQLLAESRTWALPKGGQAVRGHATFQESGNVLVIHTAGSAILTFSSFDIGKGEQVSILQAPNSRLLLRILSSDPTRIFGALDSQSTVSLVNPNGIYFQSDSASQVGNLYVISGAYSDADFIRNRYHFTALSGDVVNSGEMAAKTGVHLFGQHVLNTANLSSVSGAVVLGSGTEVTTTSRDLVLQLSNNSDGSQTSTPGVHNSGNIRAPRTFVGAGDTPAIGFYNTGAITSPSINLSAGAGSAIKLQGTLDASLLGARGLGGKIVITGKEVNLLSAVMNANGPQGGGRITIGGNLNGAGTLPKAPSVSMDASSSIKANATSRGGGGSVVLWSTEATSFKGNIEAKGERPQTGPLSRGRVRGGTVQIASQGALDFTGTVDVSSPDAEGKLFTSKTTKSR